MTGFGKYIYKTHCYQTVKIQKVRQIYCLQETVQIINYVNTLFQTFMIF